MSILHLPANAALLRPPGRTISPASQRRRRPRRRLVGVAQIAGVRNFHRVGFRRPDKAEGVAADHNVVNGLSDFRHVAGDALGSRTSSGMVSVLLYTRRMWPILRVRTVARQTKGVALLPYNSRIVVAMWIVATEAGHSARIHETCDEIVPLHSVLMGCSICKVREGCLSKFVFFQLPEVRQLQTDMKAHRPIVVFPVDRVFQGPTL